MTGPQLALVVVLCAALGAVGALVVLGAGKLGRGGGDGIEALADATRECTCCLADWGPCTCAEPCKSIRCTAWAGAIAPTPLRIVRDTKENTQ